MASLDLSATIVRLNKAISDLTSAGADTRALQEEVDKLKGMEQDFEGLLQDFGEMKEDLDAREKRLQEKEDDWDFRDNDLRREREALEKREQRMREKERRFRVLDGVFSPENEVTLTRMVGATPSWADLRKVYVEMMDETTLDFAVVQLTDFETWMEENFTRVFGRQPQAGNISVAPSLSNILRPPSIPQSTPRYIAPPTIHRPQGYDMRSTSSLVRDGRRGDLYSYPTPALDNTPMRPRPMPVVNLPRPQRRDGRPMTETRSRMMYD